MLARSWCAGRTTVAGRMRDTPANMLDSAPFSAALPASVRACHAHDAHTRGVGVAQGAGEPRNSGRRRRAQRATVAKQEPRVPLWDAVVAQAQGRAQARAREWARPPPRSGAEVQSRGGHVRDTPSRAADIAGVGATGRPPGRQGRAVNAEPRGLLYPHAPSPTGTSALDGLCPHGVLGSPHAVLGDGRRFVYHRASWTQRRARGGRPHFVLLPVLRHIHETTAEKMAGLQTACSKRLEGSHVAFCPRVAPASAASAAATIVLHGSCARD